MVDPIAMRQIRDVSVFENMLPYLRDHVEKQLRALDNRVMTRLEEGNLAPQDALNAWIERNMWRKLLNSFEKSIKIGQSAGEANRAALDFPSKVGY